jgi:hypothetical protein
MPVLESDLAPSLMYFSSLGITVSPSVDTVLKHLNNLISKGNQSDEITKS